ncbi:isomerase [Bdellovibrio bacteriovorus]|uniref:Isomerase n=1 Tax=Bdellovibrio bacteriovorus TaxID=959 RepID=A0A150WCF8_BDEBC|nr:nuclear transport factor 2 family protein [Bdellovibrio bacteriovorus]KYG60633.1 isomerase [Bdellovibrio bacteriovorus]
MKTKNESIRTKAQETFEKHLEYLSTGNISAWMALWNEGGVLEFPFGLKEYPAQVSGNEAIHEYIRHFPNYLKIEFTKPTYHLTEDPNLVIAEFKGFGKMVTNGRPYNQTYISVVKTTNGKIDTYKDFWNPLVLQTALGENNKYDGATANM